MNTALELRSITRTYGVDPNVVTAIKSVDLKVNIGELVAVMGPSGSGKSTLLTIAGGLETPTSGQVLIDGQDLSSMNVNQRASLRRRKIGYVFQDLNLLAPLTAVENVALPMELDGMKSSQAAKKALAALQRVGVSDKAERFPDDLSGGERQRVAIARAVATKGRLLLADEPTGALDSVNGEQVMRVLRDACDEGAASIMVTHDSQLAAWADRVIFIKDGKINDQTETSSGVESLLEETSP